ncbi:uncharacterized protein BDR25DRAFT_35778 [Lindgomyces ingoldianus]|uniref:Uncharacterized protein n=1 Tax=Lindgomyces ingoldianus TaxID=673940 RepID=A0ACB6QSP7_9PLEO|nr:uncharacterized protein BDR25DRAFT_35778 [Lindgomyces ingoldianus]KAF2469951.1 hypothetical protein BDR25DRAFT_35778 [Lindgomyces ingoldianus]
MLKMAIVTHLKLPLATYTSVLISLSLPLVDSSGSSFKTFYCLVQTEGHLVIVGQHLLLFVGFFIFEKGGHRERT